MTEEYAHYASHRRKINIPYSSKLLFHKGGMGSINKNELSNLAP